MPLLTREDCIVTRTPREEICLEKFGYPKGTYLLMRQLTAKEMLSLRKNSGASPELGNLAFVYSLLSLVLVDADSAPMYANAQDMMENFNLAMPVLEFLSVEALRVSGIEVTEKN